MKKFFLTISVFSLFLTAQSQEKIKNPDVNKAVEGAVTQSKTAVEGALKTRNLKENLHEGWNKSNQFGINYNATGFNNYWRGINRESKGNQALGFLFNHKSSYLKGKNIWVNDFQGQIGFLKQQGTAFARNVDKLLFNSLYGREISHKFSYFVEANLITQFLKDEDKSLLSSKNVNSAFFAPAYLTLATGIEYHPKDYLTLKLAPIANKSTFVLNDDIKTVDGHAYGVNIDGGKKMLNEFGSQLTVGFGKEILKNVNLGFRYNAFQAWKKRTGRYITDVDLDAQNDEERFIRSADNKTLNTLDHRLDAIVTAKVNKYLNVNFTYIGILDRDVIGKWQSASGLNIGFLVNMDDVVSNEKKSVK